MKNKAEHFLVEQDLLQVSIGVFPIDHAAVKNYPLGEVKVHLEDKEVRVIKNSSGYFVLVNLPDGPYRVYVEAEYYFSKDFMLQLPPPAVPVAPVDEVELQVYQGVLLALVTLHPKPTYPFLAGSSLIRGMVFDADENPVSGALVRVIGKPVQNLTTNNGEFVLYFQNLSEEDIILIDGKKFILGNGDENIRIEADHPVFGTSPTIITRLEEGTTVSARIDYP